MKNILTILALVFSVVLLAQEGENKPKLEIENGMVKATYYHDNGVVSQSGTYVEGKLHGEWKSFDEKGNAIAIANYDMGAKNGNWFFFHDNTLKEVIYENNAIASVKTWNQSNKIVVNP